jgi:RNA polymerase sigma-70 factor (ECF subfamily)
MQLVTRHQAQLFGYLYALVRNLEDADDLYQQTTLLLWKKFDEFEAGSNFAGWACRVARFEALAFLQKKRRSRLVFDEDVILALADVEFDVRRADDRRDALEKCLAKLPAPDRELLELAYADESHIHEIAAAIGRSAQSVYNSLSRIRQALFACVQRSLAVQEAT